MIGGSTPCCQGTNPRPTQDAICGWFFNTQGADGANVVRHHPICGM